MVGEEHGIRVQLHPTLVDGTHVYTCCESHSVFGMLDLPSADVLAQIDILKHTIDQQAALLVDKEREAVKRVQASREEEWVKLHKVENEK